MGRGIKWESGTEHRKSIMLPEGSSSSFEMEGQSPREPHHQVREEGC